MSARDLHATVCWPSRSGCGCSEPTAKEAVSSSHKFNLKKGKRAAKSEAEHVVGLRVRGGGCGPSKASGQDPHVNATPSGAQGSPPLLQQQATPQEAAVQRVKAEAMQREAKEEAERAALRESARAHLSGSMRQLSYFDDGLLGALQVGGIRLVRCAWFLAQPAGYRIVRRQDLEALEREGSSPSPLLSAQEAVELVCSGTRAMGVLTYGWYVPAHALECAHLSLRLYRRR